MLRTKKFWADVVLATAFIFFFMWGASKFLGIFDFMDPIGDALGEFQLTDQVYSDPAFRQLPPADTSVVVVNIGHLTRGEIGQQISIISSYGPAAIGLDMIFRSRKADTLGDMILANAIANAENVVMYEKLIEPNEENIWTASELSDPFFSAGIATASVNLVAEEANAAQHEAKTCRTIFPMEQRLDTVTQELFNVPAFSVKLAESLNPEAVARFVARGNDEEIVNYRGNIADMGSTAFGGRYFVLDTYQVLEENFAPDLIKDKIIIFGFLGSYLGDPWTNEDKSLHR